MNDVEELVHYCKEDDPIGALLFTGEWGSGKTHVIEHDLVDALGLDYAIVRVSLFGLNDIRAVNEAVRRKWISVCYPIADRLIKGKEEAKRTGGFFSFINSLLKITNPIAGTTADFIASVNLTDIINIKPHFEDIKLHRERKAILVFDDLERCNVSLSDLLGVVNEFCENQHFNTIIVTNMKYLMRIMKDDLFVLNMLREKTISQTVLYRPDFQAIVHKIITKREWPSKEYGKYLLDHEEQILDVFTNEPVSKKKGAVYEKQHNLLTLISALQSFYRLYHHIESKGAKDYDDILASFVSYSLCHSNGLYINDELLFRFSDEDVAIFYPQFKSEALFPSVREWIKTGGFEKEDFYKELDAYLEKKAS